MTIGFALFAVRAHELVVELKIHPHPGGDAEESAQAEVILGSASALALFHLREMGRGNPVAAGDLGLGQAGFLKGFAEGPTARKIQRRVAAHTRRSSTAYAP